METFMISDKAFINVLEDSDQITLTWKGTIDSDYANTVMRDFLMDFHEKCKQKNISRIVSDFRGIRFMFSSGINTLIGWFKLFSDEKNYSLAIVYNNKIRWQDVTFESLHMIIEEIELIIKEGPPD